MKKIVLFAVLAMWGLFASAQSRCNINKVWAFYTVSYPGVQMADENGNPIPPKPTIERMIYIEWCGSKKPEIKEVLYDNMSFSAVVEKVEGRSVIPGKDLSPENTTPITASRCKKLWKIILIAKEDRPVLEPGSKNIVIKMKGCVFLNKKETRLKTLPRP